MQIYENIFNLQAILKIFFTFALIHTSEGGRLAVAKGLVYSEPFVFKRTPDLLRTPQHLIGGGKRPALVRWAGAEYFATVSVTYTSMFTDTFNSVAGTWRKDTKR